MWKRKGEREKERIHRLDTLAPLPHVCLLPELPFCGRNSASVEVSPWFRGRLEQLADVQEPVRGEGHYVREGLSLVGVDLLRRSGILVGVCGLAPGKEKRVDGDSRARPGARLGRHLAGCRLRAPLRGRPGR